jgi:hypothetical protein
MSKRWWTPPTVEATGRKWKPPPKPDPKMERCEGCDKDTNSSFMRNTQVEPGIFRFLCPRCVNGTREETDARDPGPTPPGGHAP